MSDEKTPAEGEAEAHSRTRVPLSYGAASGLSDDTLGLFGALTRDPVRAKGTLKDAVPLREALSALHAVVHSDLRYKPKDRTAYQAFQRMRKQSAGLSAWAAQQAYFDWLARNDPTAWLILDPVVTVHPDALLFEVFSKDEGTYAQLSVDWSAVALDGELACGTTHIDFSDALMEGVQRIRSYRPTTLDISRDAVALQTEGHEVLEKQVELPDSWLRGFLQVQSAATLARARFQLAPVDLYNALRHLRLNADQKKKGRAIRVELIPGEQPRIVLEPWEQVIECGGAPYAGRTPEVVRIWGRRRLLLLRRFLPFVESVDVALLGSGLPSFWTLRSGPLSLSLGLTGFNASDWARALSFDVLLPRPGAADAAQEKVLAALRETWVADRARLAQVTGLSPADTLRALQGAAQAGAVVDDLATDQYRLRPLLHTPIDPARLQFRNPRERQAHDLLATKGAVRLTQENHIHGQGLELTGRVEVASEKREYRPQVLVADDGRVVRAECTCTFFRKHQLKQGPCAHLVALRLLQAEADAKRAAQRGKARKTVVMETRTYARRRPGGSESICQVALDRQRLKVRWGERGDARLRVQTLFFDDVADAREAYFARVDDLEAKGFLDATAS